MESSSTHRRIVSVEGPIDLWLTLAPLKRGQVDPTMRLEASSVWRAFRCPEGPATVHLSPHDKGVEVEAWGPGAGWALEAAPSLIGAHDDPEALQPKHPLVKELTRRMPGIRFPSWPTVVEIMIPTVLE